MNSAGFQCDAFDVVSSDGRNFTLNRPFVFVAKDGEEITVPAGSTMDGASTPRFLWRVLPPFGNYWMSAGLHDWLYRRSGFAKSRCDDLFLEAMLDEKVEAWKAKAIYLGVHLFGQSSFNEDRA